MTRELRRITLSAQELTEAVGGYRKVDNKFLPPGKICEVAATAEHVTTKIEMKYVDSVHVLEFNIPYVKLTDVLINFCVERGIPVPRVGKKSAVLVESEVALEINVGGDPAIAANPAAAAARPAAAAPVLKAG